MTQQLFYYTKDIDVEKLEEAVCAEFRIERKNLREQCRKYDYAKARQMVWKILRDEGYKYVTLGRMYKRDHGAIISGVKSISNAIEVNRVIGGKYQKVRSLFR